MTKRKKILVAFIALLLSLNLAHAQDYSLFSGKFYEPKGEEKINFELYNGTYALCENEKKTIPVLVVNRDAKIDNKYSLDIAGASWASLNVKEFSLQKKQSGVVFVELNPPQSTNGKYSVVVSSLSSVGSIRKEISLDVNIEKCYSVDLQLEHEYDKVCGGAKKAYRGEIINDGNKRIDAELGLQGANWAKVDENGFSLNPGNRQNFELNIDVPENERGTFYVVANAIIKSLSIKSEKTLKLDIVPKYDCYKAGFISNTKIKNHYSSSYAPIKIINNGIEKAEYEISLEAPDWVSIEPSNLIVNPGQQGNINLNLNPSANVSEGTYAIRIDARFNGMAYPRDIEVVLSKDKLSGIEYFFAFYKYYLYIVFLVFIAFAVIKTRLISRIKRNYKDYKIRKSRLKALEAAREARRTRKK